jgi:hypothetical protein
MQPAPGFVANPQAQRPALSRHLPPPPPGKSLVFLAYKHTVLFSRSLSGRRHFQGRSSLRHCEARSAEAIVPAYGWLTEFAASPWLAYRKLLDIHPLDCFAIARNDGRYTRNDGGHTRNDGRYTRNDGGHTRNDGEYTHSSLLKAGHSAGPVHTQEPQKVVQE